MQQLSLAANGAEKKLSAEDVGCERMWEWREQGDEVGEQTGKQGRKRQWRSCGELTEGERGRGRRKRWRKRQEVLEGIGGEIWARNMTSPSVWVIVASLLLYCQLSLHFPPFLPSPAQSLAPLTDAPGIVRQIHTSRLDRVTSLSGSSELHFEDYLVDALWRLISHFISNIYVVCNFVTSNFWGV